MVSNIENNKPQPLCCEKPLSKESFIKIINLALTPNTSIHKTMAFAKEMLVEIADKLVKYDEYLLASKNKLNVISNNSYQDRLQRHYYDSLQLFVPISQYIINKQLKEVRLIDLGSGAGFPGIVLASLAEIFCQYMGVSLFHVKLIESRKKKAKFLSEAVDIMHLQNVEILNTRIESLSDVSVNIITARALSNIDQLLQYACCLSPSAVCFFHKGENVKEEVSASKKIKNYTIKLHQSRVNENSYLLECFLKNSNKLLKDN